MKWWEKLVGLEEPEDIIPTIMPILILVRFGTLLSLKLKGFMSSISRMSGK